MDASKVTAWVATATALLGLYIAVRTELLNDKTDKLAVQTTVLKENVALATANAELAAKQTDRLIRDNQEHRSSEQFNLDYNKLVYTEVSKIFDVGTLPCPKQHAINAFIDSLRDSSFKIGMAKAVGAAAGSTCEGVKSTAGDILASTTFDLDQSATLRTAVAKAEQQRPTSTTQAGAPGGWDYDVFWCEASFVGKEPAGKDAASKIVEAIAKADAGHGRIRIRSLPRAVNDRPGYGVSGYQIRAEPGEQVQAGKIKPALDSALRADVVIRPSTQPTPWYLSVFACP